MSGRPIVRICECCLKVIEIASDSQIEPGVTLCGAEYKLCAKCDELARNRTKIEVRERKTGRVWVVEIDPCYKESDVKRGFRPRVSVWSKYELDDNMPLDDKEWKHVWRKSEVSWSSIGAVDPAEAADFAEAIRIASQYGAEMNREHGISVTHPDTSASSTGPEKSGPQ